MRIRTIHFALFMLVFFAAASIAGAQTQPPRLFFTDLDSGVNTGGQAVGSFSGAFVTLYGNFLGSSQGSSTVTWNGQNCLQVVAPSGSYSGWGSAHFWYQEIVVQLGASCTPGTGNFVVTVNGTPSNGIPFTVRTSGHIYFVSTSGKDTNAGTFAAPWATVLNAKNTMAAGDTTYVETGVTATASDNFSANLSIQSAGVAGSPIALGAYPGAAVTVGSSSGPGFALRIPNISVNASYWTVFGITWNGGSGDAMNITGAGGTTPNTNWRVVGNLFTCPTANGEDGCFETNQMNYTYFYGNETTGVSSALGFVANKEAHADYFSTDSNHTWFGWNYVHDNMSCRALQFHSSPLNGGGSGDPTGHNMYDLHVFDNYFYNDPCDAINFATIDPSQGPVEAYNNVIVHTGTGPSPQGGDSGDYSCIYFAYITNTGANGGGTADIYNNTLYDCGADTSLSSQNGAFQIGVQYNTLFVALFNNVVYLLPTETYVNGSPSGFVSGSNNLWFGSTQAAPTYTTGNITTNPNLLSVASLNFHLQAGSPALNAGLNLTSANMYNNYPTFMNVVTDHDGLSRPQGTNMSVGAYELFSGAAAVRPNPPTNLTVVVH